MLRRVFTLLIVALTSTWVQAAPHALDKFLTDLKTLQADFHQRVLDEKGATLETASGRLSMQRPNQFRWAYQTPYEQLIIADGETIWIYDADLDQVTIKAFDGAVGHSPALLLSGEDSVQSAFNVETTQTDKGERLHLTPKSEQSQFQQIELYFEADQIQHLRLADNLGQTTHIEFSNVQRNPPLEAGLFQFNPPADADVIDGRE